jgi:hypothetical protein
MYDMFYVTGLAKTKCFAEILTKNNLKKISEAIQKI